MQKDLIARPLCISSPYGVRLSHSCIFSKHKISSQIFFTVGQLHHSSFSTPNVMAIFRRGPS